MANNSTVNKLKRIIAKTPVIGQVILFLLRVKITSGHFFSQLSTLLKWLFKSKETTNFTYNLEEDNKNYLASMVADILNIDYDTVVKYVKEIENDEQLHRHIINITINSGLSFKADKEVRLGRRMGWYVFVRVLKPKVVVETGVDKGLGSCVLTAALKRNSEEGHAGKYYGTDINPDAGYLLSGEYARFGEILYGDSIQSLKKLNEKIDLFVNDSDHSSSYEAEEYEVVADKLSERAVILGDNSHCTNELLNFSLKNNRHFVFFQERPLNHWYPGAGIGISFIR